MAPHQTKTITPGCRGSHRTSITPRLHAARISTFPHARGPHHHNPRFSAVAMGPWRRQFHTMASKCSHVKFHSPTTPKYRYSKYPKSLISTPAPKLHKRNHGTRSLKDRRDRVPVHRTTRTRCCHGAEISRFLRVRRPHCYYQRLSVFVLTSCI